MLNRGREIASFRVVRRIRNPSLVVCGLLAAILARWVHAALFAYIPNDDSTVSVIDTGTNTVVNTLHVGNSPVGIAPFPTRPGIFITNSGDNSVTVISE